MFLTKLKLAAAATVALGIAAAGVAAQQIGTPARTSSDEDRLRQVEQKLDRVLQALENRTGTTAPQGPAATTSVSLGGNPGLTVTPANPAATVSGSTLGANPGLTVASDEPKTATTTGIVATGPVGQALNADRPKDRSNSRTMALAGRPADRLTRVEQRLDDLERRISRLEQQHAATSATGGAAITVGGGGTTAEETTQPKQ